MYAAPTPCAVPSSSTSCARSRTIGRSTSRPCAGDMNGMPATARATSSKLGMSGSFQHAADARHRGPHRPRQDRARARADRRRHRPAAGGEGARDLDRARLRAADAGLSADAQRRRRARPRALRAHDGRGRDRDRPVPDGRRRRRRRDAADARARGGAGRARRRDRRGRDHQEPTSRTPSERCAEAAELLPGAEIVPVSARTGDGLDELRAALERAAARVASRSGGEGRCACTSTACSPSTAPAPSSPARCGPARRRAASTSPSCRAASRARIRGVEVHDERGRARRGRTARRAEPRSDRDEIARGDVIADGPLAATYRVDVALAWVERPERRRADRRPSRHARVGGAARRARRALTSSCGSSSRSCPPPGDRLVIRSLAPPNTLGGGVVLDPHRATGRRATCSRGSRSGRAEPDAAAGAGARRSPERAPLSADALALEARLRAAGHEPPLDEDRELLAELREHGRAVRLGPTMHIHTDALDDVRDRVIAAIERDGEITLARPARRAADLAQVRPGAARALRRRARHAPPRRRARAQAPALNAASQNASSCSLEATNAARSPGRRVDQLARPGRELAELVRGVHVDPLAVAVRRVRGGQRRADLGIAQHARRHGADQFAEVAQRRRAQQKVAVRGGGGRRLARLEVARSRPSAQRTRGAAPSRSPAPTGRARRSAASTPAAAPARHPATAAARSRSGTRSPGGCRSGTPPRAASRRRSRARTGARAARPRRAGGPRRRAEAAQAPAGFGAVGSPPSAPGCSRAM